MTKTKKLNQSHTYMKLFSSMLLVGSIGIIFAGCSCRSPTVAPPQASPLVATPKENPTKTTQSKEIAVDDPKPVLRIGDVSELKDDRTCDDKGYILVYGETEKYIVYICTDDQNSIEPLYFKIRDKYKGASSTIEGQAYLSLTEDSFVGMSGEHSIELMLPMSKRQVIYERPFLFIGLYSNIIDPSTSREPLVLYLSTKQLEEFQKLDAWKSKSSSDPQYNAIKKKLVQYVESQKDKLGVCMTDRRNRDNEGKYARIYKVDDQKYLFAFDCTYDTKNSYSSYFLVYMKDDQFEVKPLAFNNEYHPNKYEPTDPYTAYGQPYYNSRTQILSVNWRIRTCGALYNYKLEKDELILQEVRATRNCADYRYIDPVLYPLIYP